MKFSDAIDHYIRDMRLAGRINSPNTERTYRDLLGLHADDIGNRDPRTIGREDCKTTLARWQNPNTIRGRRAVLVSFYDWAMEEGHRKDNPARQTRRPKKRPTSVYRLTATEVDAMWNTCINVIERRAIHIGLAAGLRSAELRGLKGLHFQREGFIWVSADIAKGGRERYVPILADLQPDIDDIVATVAPAHYVLPGQRNANPPHNSRYTPVPERPMGGPTLWRIVGRVAERAGISAHIHPHLLRHAYADHIARHTGLRTAQALMGHADVGTTQGYIGKPTLDELVDALRDVGIGTSRRPDPKPSAATPRKEGPQMAHGDGGNRTRGLSRSTSRAENGGS